jgi:hypothetical protein
MAEETKKTRQKSPKFPAMGLDRAIEVIKEASKLGRTFQPETFASFCLRRDAKGSVKSGAFIRRVAALKYYGLIEEKGSQIELTKLTEQILYPKDEQERIGAIRESFLRPLLFKKLYDAIEKEVSIKKERLANMSVREYGIAPNAMEDFISSFISSAKFAGFLKVDPNDKDSVIFSEAKKESPGSGEGLSLGSDEEQRKIEWSMAISKKDEVGNYELQFRSKEMLSGDLLDELSKFIEKLEQEFSKTEKESPKSSIRKIDREK